MATKRARRTGEVPVGINKMVIVTPAVSISAEELAKAVSARGIQKAVVELASKEGLGSSEVVPKLAAARFREIGELTSELAKGGPLNRDLVQSTIAKVTIAPEKIREGLGIKSINLPGFSESNATFAANGLYRFIKSLTNSDLDRLMKEPITRIFFGTESNPDRSRPEFEVALLMVTSKLLEEGEQQYRWIIDMLRGAVVVPITYACVGGMLGLDSALTKVRESLHTKGKRRSALLLTVDTACYDDRTAPNAELTQGAAMSLCWVTRKPALVEFGHAVGGSHLPIADFTKFAKETPFVHGKFSEITYLYLVAKAVRSLERTLGGALSMRKIGYFLSHVPFPKQGIYYASLLFAHYNRGANPEFFRELQSRSGIGSEPLNGYGSFTEMVEAKFRAFNADQGAEALPESAVIKHIEADGEIRAYLDWLKGVRKTPEFREFTKRLHIDDELELPSIIGNSYSSSIFAALASVLLYVPEVREAKNRGVMVGYGSGGETIALLIEIVATSRTVGQNLEVRIDKGYPIDAERYFDQLHPALVSGEAVRHMVPPGEDLLAKDIALLRTDALQDGFHVKRRNADGTGEYVYVSGGKPEPIRIRY